MKIDVITRHAISNYGSLLQAMATQYAIENLGHTCEIIDYIPECEKITKTEIALLKKKSEWNSNFLKRFIYILLRQPVAVISGLAFRRWRKKHLNLTERYICYEELLSNKPQADVYLTGSDQVWGPITSGDCDKSYCLFFTDDGEKRVSYAASIGHSQMDNKTAEFFKDWLKRYEHITVRENAAVKMLEDIGISATAVLDPTLLLDANEWNKIAAKKRDKKYILVYQIHNNDKLNEYAKKVSKQTGLPLIRISCSLHQIFRGGHCKYLPDLGEFLAYIRDAECVVTDSFHGTAFAINFNVPFVEVLSKNGTQIRNQSILELTGLTDRILNDCNDVSLATKPIDYTAVGKIISEKREESYNCLKFMIEQ